MRWVDEKGKRRVKRKRRYQMQKSGLDNQKVEMLLVKYKFFRYKLPNRSTNTDKAANINRCNQNGGQTWLKW